MHNVIIFAEEATEGMFLDDIVNVIKQNAYLFCQYRSATSGHG